jgi:hypothetical protein
MHQVEVSPRGEESSGDRPVTKPTIGIAACCAPAASGQALAVTAKRLMKYRRVIAPRSMCFSTLPVGIIITVPPKAGAGPWIILKCSESGRRSAVAASRGVRI